MLHVELASGTQAWHTIRMRRIALAFVLLAACGSSDTKQPAAGSGSAGSGSGSAAKYDALGKRPTNPRRPTPPPGIESTALAVGAKVPALALVDSAGAPWRLTDSLANQARVMLVFYRGDW